ncbi:alpha/beta fold hydrolase [Micromonospora sp. NPDC050397]|uniref:alpha/beta fold hydrolase n=1 Tax=Micromonospora sp. NPDC050397 TaxID=3364279 RepID=UPI00384DB217
MSLLTAPNQTVDAPNGSTYTYRNFGKVGGTPVLFLQCFRGNIDIWDPALVDAIAAEREVILFDASGVGGSTGQTPETVREYARDTLAFVDALGLTMVDLLGFSLGGFVAQEVTLQRPYLVRRLVLAGTGPQGGRGFHAWSGETRVHAHKEQQDAEDLLYLFFSPSEQSRAKGMEYIGRIFSRQQDRDTPATLAVRDAQLAAIADWGIPDSGRFSRLSAIGQPTLVANGDHDVMVPTPNSYLLAGHLPDAELVIYPDANHGFLFQYPQEFAGEVNRFLTRA